MAKKRPKNNERKLGGEIARDYCKRFPSAPTLTLAKKLVREHGTLFTSVEQARSRLRYYRGEHGDKARDEARNSMVSTTKAKTLALPKSTTKEIKPYKLKVRGAGLVVSDVHVPHHDEHALRLALKYAIGHGHTDYIILNGDIIDAYQISHWTRDPRERSFAGELRDVRQLLETLADNFGAVIYKLGNHERRYETYMRLKAPELLDVEEFGWHHILHCHDTGVTLIPDRQVIHAGQLTILHGHEYGRGVFNPVNPARGMYLRAKSCTLSGHLHQTSQHNEADVRKNLTSCWSTGCLCGLSPEYAPLNRWDHGFALMEFDGKWFEVTTKRIVKGRVV